LLTGSLKKKYIDEFFGQGRPWNINNQIIRLYGDMEPPFGKQYMNKCMFFTGLCYQMATASSLALG